MSINLSRSPYYYKVVPTTSTPTMTRAVTEVSIWNGAETPIPASTYTINKIPIGTDQFIVLELSNLIKDFINITYEGTYQSSSIQNYWLSSSTIFYDSTNTQIGTTVVTPTELYSKGFGYFNRGANFDIELGYGSDNMEICVPMFKPIYVPIYNSQAGDSVVVKFYNGTYDQAVAGENEIGTSTELLYIQNSNSQMAYATPTSVGIENDLNIQQYDQLLNSFPNQFVYNSSLKNNDYPFCPSYDYVVTWIEIIRSVSGVEFSKWVKVNTKIKDKYDPIKIVFVNRFGMYEDLWCFGNNRKSIEINTDTFKRSLLDRDTISYNSDAHQYKTFADQGREKITISTGYLPEQTNDVIKQIMLSQQIWLVDMDSNIEPVNLKSKNLSYKTHLTEKLIDYQFEFGYAYDIINRVV